MAGGGRPSTSCDARAKEDVDGGAKPRHDDVASPRFSVRSEASGNLHRSAQRDGDCFAPLAMTGRHASERRAVVRQDPSRARQYQAAAVSRCAVLTTRASIAAALRCRICSRASSPICASASAFRVQSHAELAAVGAAHDALGAVQAHRRLDRARAERVAIHVHLRPPEARRRQLLLRRVEQAAVIHALDLVGNVAAQIVDDGPSRRDTARGTR